MKFRCYIEQVEAERSRVPRRASTTWEEDTEMKELEYVDFYYYYIWHLYKLPLMILACHERAHRLLSVVKVVTLAFLKCSLIVIDI